MALDINQIFADILPDPKKELEEKALTRSALLTKGQSGPLAGLAATMGYNSALAGEGMRQGLNRATGGALSTASERMNSELKNLDPSNPQDQAEMLRIVRRERGTGAAEQLREVFRQRAMQDTKIGLDKETVRQNAVRLGIEQRTADTNEFIANTGRINALVNQSQNALAYAESLQSAAGVSGGKMANMTPLTGGYYMGADVYGNVRLTGPEGVVPPDQVSNKLKELEDEAIQTEVTRRRALEQENVRGQMLAKNIEDIETLRSSRVTVLEVINELEQGASSGMIRSKLPALDENTRRLRQLGRQMGLDVISGATFGALSEKEMEVAMSVGLDLSQSPAQLLEQMREKARLQSILMDQYRTVAIGLVNGKDLPEIIQEINDNADDYEQEIVSGGSRAAESQERDQVNRNIILYGSPDGGIQNAGRRGSRPR